MQIQITAQTRRLAGARVSDPVVHVGRRSLVADGNIPVSLRKLVPYGWGNAKPDAWRPFVERAILLGKL